MIIIYHDSFSSAQHVFKTFGPQIPFLGGTLLEYSFMLYYSIAKSINQPIKIYLPANWQDVLPEGVVESCYFYDNILNIDLKERELVFMTDVFTLPLAGFTNIGFLENHAGKMFDVNNVKVGVVNSNDLKNMRLEADNDLLDTVVLDDHNFLPFARIALERTSFREEPLIISADNTVYGNPIVKSKNITNSRIYGPCYIDEESTIRNSTILPGSIILKSNIVDTTVLGSFIHDSSTKQSNLDEVLSSGAIISNVEIHNSIIPSTARLRGGIKKEAN